MKAILDSKRYGVWALITGASSGIGKVNFTFSKRKSHVIHRSHR